jgi:flagellar basal-body rod protein FlgB
VASLGVTDAVSSILTTAIDGLTDRQNVIANNIANVDTPNFRAQSVDFEDSLQQAISAGEYNDSASAPDVEITATPTQTPVGANGNNVDLRKEEVAMIQTQYSYQIIGRALSDHFSLLQEATSMS